MFRRLDLVVKLLVRLVDQALAQRIFFLLGHLRVVERVHPQDFVLLNHPSLTLDTSPMLTVVESLKVCVHDKSFSFFAN